jgi:phosphoglucan,water dikinase
VCDSLRLLITSCHPAGGVAEKLAKTLPPGARVCVRSSANVEDLAGMSGAGLYDSIAGVPTADPAALGAAISAVWASLHTPHAVRARTAAGVRQGDAAMAVLIQEQVPSQLAFVLHTRSPIGAPDAVLAELCVGHGETLASGARGSGWRLEVSPAGVVTPRGFANFSTALTPPRDGGTGMGAVPVDYSRQPLTRDPNARQALGTRLGAVGRALQAELGGVPQDVEGALVGDVVYVVQSRPQPL